MQLTQEKIAMHAAVSHRPTWFSHNSFLTTQPRHWQSWLEYFNSDIDIGLFCTSLRGRIPHYVAGAKVFIYLLKPETLIGKYNGRGVPPPSTYFISKQHFWNSSHKLYTYRILVLGIWCRDGNVYLDRSCAQQYWLIPKKLWTL